MSDAFRPADLESFLDEALPIEEMTRIEKTLRDEPALAKQLAAVIARRDSGVVSLGEIWRRHRLSCPSRQDLASMLLGVLPDALADYLRFHLDVVGCRYCQANLADLKDQQSEAQSSTQVRRRKYFQSSAGHLQAKPTR